MLLQSRLITVSHKIGGDLSALKPAVPDLSGRCDDASASDCYDINTSEKIIQNVLELTPKTFWMIFLPSREEIWRI